MAIKHYSTLAYENLDEFVYGRAKKPVTLKNGLVIGGGTLYPEVNFTLPTMQITKETMPEVIRQYKEIINGVCKRATELYLPGLIAELELLPPTTYNPGWGIEITKVLKDIMNNYEQNHGLKSGLRVTPVDIREDKKSPHMWHGSHWDAVMETFEGAAREGADLIAIESIGGKDIHDDANIYCEIDKAIFALGILGARDMQKLWGNIVSIAQKTGSIASGDTACGFANTAMVLADRGMVPKVFAAVDRVVSAVRSLVAIEEGAVGPHKDCGYEGVYVKAITGTPIAMEGKTSACAHLSPVGNIAACVADLWSNESVQNIKLLGGMAPTIYLEQLAYDCRLMNTAASTGNSKLMRDWLSDSDSVYDPQAYVLRPDVVLEISREIIKEDSHFKRSVTAARMAVEVLRKAIKDGKTKIDEKEVVWLDTMEQQIDNIPKDEQEFISNMIEANESEKFVPAKYDL
jgi:methanol--5-hydroxybenzimidazolylcobamide Co-methyltransferase